MVKTFILIIPKLDFQFYHLLLTDMTRIRADLNHYFNFFLKKYKNCNLVNWIRLNAFKHKATNLTLTIKVPINFISLNETSMKFKYLIEFFFKVIKSNAEQNGKSWKF